MKLLTKEIKKRLPRIGATDGTPMGDRVCVVKFFNPCGSGTWWIIEGEEQPDGDWLLFGLADLGSPEFGYVSLNELASVRLPMGLTIERDLYFSRDKLSKVVPESVRARTVLLRDTVESPVVVVDVDPEMAFEIAANFDPGTKIVNVQTGESWRIPR